MKIDGAKLARWIVGLGLLAVAITILFPTTCRSRDSLRRSSCQSNLKQIWMAARQYAQDFENRWVEVSENGRSWRDSLNFYTRNDAVFACPSASSGDLGMGRSDYFFNARLAGRAQNAVGNPVWLVAFGDGFQNAPGNAHSVEFPLANANEEGFWSRHLTGANYLFADGHVKWMRIQNARETAHFAPEQRGQTGNSKVR